MESVGPYRVERLIGRGGMAEVHRATHFGASGFHKPVALKRLLDGLRGTPELEKRLIEEARLGARLSHRNLVSTLDLGVDGGSYYVVLELVEGLDLEALIRIERLPSELAWLVIEEIAAGLEALHELGDEAGRSLGLVHRDLSPSNVLISRAGEVKLADFGLLKATLRLEDTHPNIRKGKYAYMSPEQVAGETLTSASDQFGLAVIAYELLTGQRPFDGPSVPETLENILAAKPKRPSGLLPEEVSFLERALSRRPRDRYAAGLELRRAIAELRRCLPLSGSAELAEWVRSRSASVIASTR